MKANQKFLRSDDAVSPVIAVILMVAITVVLAATVYVWVSGFGSNTNSSPAHTMSLVSAGAITLDTTATDHWYKTYTVSSADPSLTYGDMKVTIGGTEFTFDGTNGCSEDTLSATQANSWGGCAGSTARASTASVGAGDTITLVCRENPDTTADAEDADCLTDKDFLVLDVEANSVMVTLKIR